MQPRWPEIRRTLLSSPGHRVTGELQIAAIVLIYWDVSEWITTMNEFMATVESNIVLDMKTSEKPEW